MTDNQLRRLRKKLELFEVEAFNWVLLDLIDQVTAFSGSRILSTDTRQRIINNLRIEYLEEERSLTPDDPKQQKLQL